MNRQRNDDDEDLRRELHRLNKNVQYLADKDSVIPLKLIWWFLIVPVLIYGLFVGLMGIAAYCARHAGH